MRDGTLAVELNDMVRAQIYSELQAKQSPRLHRVAQHFEAALLSRYKTNVASQDGRLEQLADIKSMLKGLFVDISVLEDEDPAVLELPIDANTFALI